MFQFGTPVTIGAPMIQTGIPEVDAMIAELEANVLGMLEANVLKAGEIARLKARVSDLEKQAGELTEQLKALREPSQSLPPAQP